MSAPGLTWIFELCRYVEPQSNLHTSLRLRHLCCIRRDLHSIKSAEGFGSSAWFFWNLGTGQQNHVSIPMKQPTAATVGETDSVKPN